MKCLGFQSVLAGCVWRHKALGSLLRLYKPVEYTQDLVVFEVRSSLVVYSALLSFMVFQVLALGCVVRRVEFEGFRTL